MGSGEIGTYFFTQGVLGVVLIVLAGAFAFYYRSKESDIKDLNKIIFDLQAARVQEAKDISKEVITVLSDNSQTNRVLAEKIDAAKVRGS
jgi:hypothetical protein